MRVALHTYEVMDERAEMLGVLTTVLAEVGAAHCLIGGIAVGYHARLRATVDVDLLISGRKTRRVEAALQTRGYVVVRHDGMLRVYPFDSDPAKVESIADLVEWEANEALREAAKTALQAEVLGQTVSIVSRGALVALKYLAAVSSTRRVGDRYQDVADISRILDKQFGEDDEAEALRIADLMHPGAREELLRMIDDLRNDRPVKV